MAVVSNTKGIVQMARIHVVSDLHVEFAAFEVPSVKADVTVLAGDTSVGGELHPWRNAAAAFGRPVIALAGNHDLYGETIEGGLAKLRSAGSERGAVFLENDIAVIAGVRFVGCTLWTDFRLSGGDHREVEYDMAVCAERVNDFRLIRIGPEGRRFTPSDAAALHRRSIDWMLGVFGAPFEGPTVVATHHPPSPRCLDPMFPRDAVSAAFASDLEDLVGRLQPELWISGHTHFCSDFRIGRTRMLSNPRGYAPGDVAAGFDPALVVAV